MTPVALLVLVAGTLVAFTVSTTLGIGGGVLMLPPMLAVFDMPTAIAMIAPLMLINGVGKLWAFRAALDLRKALLFGALGWPLALVAALYVDRVDARILKGLIVLLIGGMLAMEHGFGRTLHLKPRALVWWGAATGVLAGLTGVSGPTLALSLKACGVTGPAFVAVVAFVVIGLQALRIPAYVSRGLLPTGQLPILAVLGGVAIAAVLLGRALQARLSIERWRIGLDLLLAAVGAFLTADILGFIPR